MSVRNRGDSEEDWDMLEDVASVDRTSKEPDSTTGIVMIVYLELTIV